jgi:hypothetical protein
VIIIPSKIIKNYSWDELIKTMIHEKVHVYQKTFPEKIDNYLKQNQYSKHSHIDANTLHRANPDTDLTIYKHSPSNKIYEMTYQSSKPRSISDTVHFSYGDEHPFEEMAIHIENL